MKFKIVYLVFSCIALWVINTSNSSGAGSSNFNCNNCHNGASSNTTIDSVVLRDVSTLDKMVKYSPSKPYIITIYGSNSGGLNRFGFQMTHNGKGSFSNPSADCQVVGNIWEHKQKITGSASKFQVSARWNAPVKGTGNVTLEAYINAVNNDNNTSGDKPSAKFSYTIEELSSADSASVEVKVLGTYDPKNPSDKITFKAYPVNGGTAPEFQWKVNSTNIGTRTTEDMFSSSTVRGGDTVSCWMYSNKVGAFPNPAISNAMVVLKTNTSSLSTSTFGRDLDMNIYDKKLFFSNLRESALLSIYTLSGKLVFKETVQPWKEVDVSAFQEGIYLFTIQKGTAFYTKKLPVR